jgi:hypothetical protein
MSARQRFGRHLSLITSVSILAGMIGNTLPSAAADASSTEQLRYQVQHSKFGKIGTYTNMVQSAGDMTTVQTTAHFLVTVLGVGLHREDAERTERWRGGRLISFVGITKKNGDTTQIKGEASDTDFVITSPFGNFNAPATVQPANPWSVRCLNSTTMMRVDTGKIERVRVTAGANTTVAIAGATIPARQYEIDGATRYQIWFDQKNIPEMFAVDDDSGKITFTLER